VLARLFHASSYSTELLPALYRVLRSMAFMARLRIAVGESLLALQIGFALIQTSGSGCH
jgi:hypothetical protein